MEGSYACNLNNRFELFLDDENDPLDLLAKTEQEKRKTGSDKKDAKKDAKKKGLSKTLVESVKTIAAAVDSKAPAKPLGRQNQNQNAPASTQGGGGGGGGADRGGNRPPRREGGNLDKRNNERNFEPRPEGDRPPRENRGPRGDGPRGPRNFNHGQQHHGGAGGGGGSRGREFDRRSGDVRSGVKPTVKRGGQGQFNWGDPTDTEVQEQEAVPETREETTEAVAEGETAEATEPQEAPVMSLDQWKKEQAAKKSKAEYSGHIRKPNEGEKEDPKLKKAIVLKKKKTEESEEEGEDAEESEDEGEKMKKQLEQTLASQFQFADPRGPARGARERRSGPPRHDGPPREHRERGAGGPHGAGGAPPRPHHNNPKPHGGHQQQQQHTPRVEDLNDFPSLAA